MSRARILVVEDQGLVAEDIRVSLGELGYEVCAVAKTGEKAIALAQQEKPDLVLMDIVLHGKVDGIEAANRIHSELHIPIVYLTAHSDEETLSRAKVAEPYGYLIKPFHDRELYCTIEMALVKHKMEQEVRESREWLSVTLRSIGDGVVATDRSGRVQFMNSSAERVTGWTEYEAKNAPLSEVLRILDEKSGKSVDPITLAFRCDRSTTSGIDRCFLLHTRDGSIKTVEATAGPILDAQGGPVGNVLVLRDVSERKAAEQRIRLLSEAVEQSSEGIALVDLKGKVIFANRAFAAMHGHGPEELLGEHISIFHKQEQLPAVEEAHRLVRAHGEFSGEVWHVRADGSVFPGLMHNSLLLDPEHHPIGIIQTLRDITDLKQAEEELRSSKKALEVYSTSLEKMVAERTEALEKSGLELARYSESLEKTNKALRILIEGIEEQKKEIEKKITHNLNLTVKPILDQLKTQEKGDTVDFLVKSLDFNLTNMFSSFGFDIVKTSQLLTPRELRVCEMIRSGLNSKQIAKVMGISPQTVLVHRKNIRKKLALARSRRNLASFLRSNPM